MKKMIIKIPDLFIVIILLMQNSFFYLIKGEFNKDITLITIIVFIIYSFFLAGKKNKEKKKKYYKWNILCFVILIITSSIAAYKTYNQPISMGIRPQRHILVNYLSYFAIYNNLVIYKKIDFKRLEKIITTLGIMEILIYGIFWLSKGSLSNIFHIPFDYRYNSIRIRANSMAIIFMFFIFLDKYLKNIEKLKSLSIMIFTVAYEILCTQTRLLSIAYLITMIFIFIIWKKKISVKLLVMPLIIIMIATFLNTTMGKDIWNQLVLKETKESSLEIRNEGKKFYKEQLKKSPIIGRGYINTLFEDSLKKSGIKDWYLVVDNGVTGFAFYYGFLGIIWMIWFFIKILKLSLKLYKKRKNYIGIIWCIFNLILSPNITWWIWSDTFIILTIIFLCIMENENLEIENGRKEELSNNEKINIDKLYV